MDQYEVEDKFDSLNINKDNMYESPGKYNCLFIIFLLNPHLDSKNNPKEFNADNPMVVTEDGFSKKGDKYSESQNEPISPQPYEGKNLKYNILENKEEEKDPELLDKDSVLIFFNQIGLTDSTKNVLIDNGFDNFESLSYLSRDVLGQLKITKETDIESLLNSLSSVAECYRNSANMREALSAYEKRIPGTVITPKLLMKWATNVKEKKRDNRGRLNQNDFLPSITHLSLENRKITQIESLDLWINLKIIYLYDNKITKIQGLEKWSKLTTLSLERNLITKIEGLENLRNLQRLYLESNCISRLEGLHTNSKLEEINLNNQKLSPGQEFTFDDLSLWAISQSLQRLDLKSCKIADPKPLFYLERLDSLNLKDNLIDNLEDVAPFLSTIKYLRVLDMRDNPLSKIKKYRDQIIMIGLTIATLDNKKVTDHERQYLLTLEMRKKGIKVPAQEKKFELTGQRSGYQSRHWYGATNQAIHKKTAQKLPKGKKMTNLGDRPPIKAGLSIVGNEMEIKHPLNDKENQRLPSGQAINEVYKPMDEYPTYEELLRQAAMPSKIEITKK